MDEEKSRMREIGRHRRRRRWHEDVLSAEENDCHGEW